MSEFSRECAVAAGDCRSCVWVSVEQAVEISSGFARSIGDSAGVA